MKTIKSILLLIAGGVFLFSITSCKDELADINQNPNAVSDPGPAFLLTGAIKTTTDAYWNVGDHSNGNPASLFVQYWAALHYTDVDRYILTNNSFEGLWTTLYAQSIANLDKVIKLGEEEDNANYKGVGIVLRSWVYSLLTDAFGAIPYSESIQIDEYTAPKYDSQKEVYEGLLDDLKTAVSLLDPEGKPIEGDIIYHGDILLWKKLANSFRLRFALRIADRQPQKAKSIIRDIADNEGHYLEDNSEIAKLRYQDAPNNNPLSDLFLTRDDFRISQSIVDRLLKLNDPRLPIYAAPTEDPTDDKYVGIPNGLTNGAASGLGASKTSKPGDYFLAPDAPAIIFSYAEVLFDCSEAAARGFTNKNPEKLYKKAITASLEQYGIDTEEINDYLSQPSIKYDPGNYKKSIGVQKWIALFGQGPEAFAEWRRLDYPKLTPAKSGVLNGEIPVRFIYPGTEQALNKENYQEAVKQQGPDLLTTSLWFDQQ